MKVFTTINPDTILNIYLITDNEQKYGVIIDPGSFSLNVYKLIQQTGAELKKIIITHNDIENTSGISLIKKIYDVEIFANCSDIFDFPITEISHGEIIKEGDLTFKILETPVNHYDSISILAEDTLFVGDILQSGILNSFRKNQCPGDYEFEIIQNNILNLPDHIIICPSKGPASTVEIERKFNPYFKNISNVIQ